MILFVVYYHVLWLGVKYKDSPTVDFFNLLCMQMFFFVSGYVSVKSFLKIDGRSIIEWLRKKIVNILIPTIMMFLFVGLYYKTDFSYYLYNDFKNGYWFTYVLFTIFILHFVQYLILSKIFTISGVVDILLFIISLFLFLLHTRIYKIFDANFLHFLSISFVLKYYFFFVLGYLAKKQEDIFKKVIIENKYVVFSLFLILIVSLFYEVNNFFMLNFITKLVLSIVLVLITYLAFYKISFFEKSNVVTRQLSLIGRHSMEIYFIHYFFIFNIPYALDVITIWQQELCFRAGGNSTVIEFLIIFPISLFLAYISIFLRKVVNLSPFISKIFLGPIPEDQLFLLLAMALVLWQFLIGYLVFSIILSIISLRASLVFIWCTLFFVPIPLLRFGFFRGFDILNIYTVLIFFFSLFNRNGRKSLGFIFRHYFKFLVIYVSILFLLFIFSETVPLKDQLRSYLREITGIFLILFFTLLEIFTVYFFFPSSLIKIYYHI